MPFIPHTEGDVRDMLASVGVGELDRLFDEIPAELQVRGIPELPPAIGEMALLRLAGERAEDDGRWLSFLGAGAYEHHVPAAVWQIATRGEFYTAYTPYQAEASQGILQTLYEFQTMMASLTAMEVSNASLYDGASALAEAVSMAVRVHARSRCVLIPRSVHPRYRAVVRTLTRAQGIEIIETDFSHRSGTTGAGAAAAPEIAAVVIPQPNFFGVLEDVDALVEAAHARGALAIALVNPISLALLKPPGEWGGQGADIAVGDGQPLGAPLSGGGPHFGFMCARRALVRQMPGRIVGRTVDAQGRTGFTLTLQAREQHIRRARATSNICTNQGLLAIAATIHLALLGASGLARTATACHANTTALCERLSAIAGVEKLFSGAIFHEAALRLPVPVAPVLERLRAERILGGYDLSADYPELGHALLVCATECRTAADIERFAHALGAALAVERAC